MDVLNIVKQKLVGDSYTDHYASLMYQVEGYKNLIRHICQSGGAEGEQFQKLLFLYQELCAEKELVFQSICERYVPDYIGDEYCITFNINISALIVRKKVGCG